MPNRFTPIQPGTESNQQINVINKNFAELDNENVIKLYNGTDGVPRILIDGSTGQIKVAPAGIDVTTATDAELNFNSSQKVFKIVETLEATIPATATATAPVGGGAHRRTNSIAIPHIYDYVPIVFAFMDYGFAKIPLPITQSFGSSGTGFQIGTRFVAADTDNITFYQELLLYDTVAGTTGSLPAVNVKAYILQESAS